jgi:gas vesicle protein
MIMFCHKSKSRMNEIRHRAGDTLHSAQGALQETLGHAPEKLEDWRHAVGETLHGVMSTLGSTAEVLKSKAELLREQAEAVGETALHSAHEIKDKRSGEAHAIMEDVRRQTNRRIDETLDNIQKRRGKVAVVQTPATISENNNDKWLWLMVGIGIGTVLGVLFAPAAGRRSRAFLRDKVARKSETSRDVGDAVAQRAADLSNRDQSATDGDATITDDGETPVG